MLQEGSYICWFIFNARVALETTLPVCKTSWDFQAHRISVWVTCAWEEWNSNDFVVFSQSTKEEDIFPKQRRFVFLLSSFGQTLFPKLYSLLDALGAQDSSNETSDQWQRVLYQIPHKNLTGLWEMASEKKYHQVIYQASFHADICRRNKNCWVNTRTAMKHSHSFL